MRRLWAGWRSSYIETTAHAPDTDESEGGCVFCRIFGLERPPEDTQIVWRSDLAVVLLNAYPYSSGHVLVLPARHVGGLEELDEAERVALWSTVHDAVTAATAAYRPDGINLGANLGKAAGAGIPGHLHIHVVPRWDGDTNFMTAVAETRVLPEALDVTWRKLTEAWPTRT